MASNNADGDHGLPPSAAYSPTGRASSGPVRTARANGLHDVSWMSVDLIESRVLHDRDVRVLAGEAFLLKIFDALPAAPHRICL